MRQKLQYHYIFYPLRFSHRGVGLRPYGFRLVELQLGEAGGCVLCLPNLPNEIIVALISSGLNLCCTYFIGAVNTTFKS